MHSVSSFFACVGKALLELAPDFLAGEKPLGNRRVAIAHKIWDAWARPLTEQQRTDELLALVQTSNEALRRSVEEAVKAVASVQPGGVRTGLGRYMLRVASALRTAFRPRKGDAASGEPVLRSVEDLIRVLPTGAEQPQKAAAPAVPESDGRGSRLVLLGGLIAAAVVALGLVGAVVIVILGGGERAPSRVEVDTTPEIKGTGTPRPVPLPPPPSVEEPAELVASSTGMKLVRIEAGTFLMGSPDTDPETTDYEKPQHKVRITKPYYLGQYEVTVGQFETFVKDNPGFLTDAEKAGEAMTWKTPRYAQTVAHPVVCVSWNDAVAFCAWQSKKEGREYRLPTEAEWEYACRAGTTTKFHFGDEVASLGDYAWYPANTRTEGARPVGGKKPNAWNLFDMHGNAWEWCADGPRKYSEAELDNPEGDKSDGRHVLRGGAWIGDTTGYCRSTYRNIWNGSTFRYDYVGFRIASSAGSAASANRAPANAVGSSGRLVVEPTLVMQFSLLDAGSFLMGSPDSDKGILHQIAKPQHRVKLTKPFCLGRYEVTVGQFEAFVRDNPGFKTEAEQDGKGSYGWDGTQWGIKPTFTWRNPGFPQDKNHPVVCVSHKDALAFCAWLSKQNRGGVEFRLPTEAEWEYACRAGSTTTFHFGDDAKQLGDYAWYELNPNGGTRSVGKKKPNAWNLFDMQGNVAECIAGGLRMYTTDEVVDPEGGPMDGRRLLRGGSWANGPALCHSALRNYFGPSDPISTSMRGFRIAHTPAMAFGPPASTRPALPGDDSQTLVAKSIPMKLVRIESGSFLMGSPASETNAHATEFPQHRVTLTKPFYLAEHEVTVGQFEAFVKANPGFLTEAEKSPNGGHGRIVGEGKWENRREFTWRTPGFKQTADHPVVCVSWNDASAFCAWLSKKEGREYRLPTEAEWEYACRAGTATKHHFSDDSATLGDNAWFADNTDAYGRNPDSGGTRPVGKKKPNAWKLFDMHGNAWEWCADDGRPYTRDEMKDPKGKEVDTLRAVRSGSWSLVAWGCRSAFRDRFGRTRADTSVGFRVACSVQNPGR